MTLYYSKRFLVKNNHSNFSKKLNSHGTEKIFFHVVVFLFYLFIYFINIINANNI